MKSEQSSMIRENFTANLNHHRFMQMAAQVMAECDKIETIFADCLGDSVEFRLAA